MHVEPESSAFSDLGDLRHATPGVNAVRLINNPYALEGAEYRRLYSDTMRGVVVDLRNWMQVTAKMRGIAVPQVSLVLGTGLGTLTTQVEIVGSRTFQECGLPSPSADGHSGQFLLANIDGHSVLLQSGRIHCYENWSPAVVALSVRAQALSGIRTFVLTNAAGALDADVHVGDLVLLTGHKGAHGYSPSSGLFDSGTREDVGPFGDKFYSVNDSYSPELRARFLQVARERGVRVHTGVYQFMPGPRFEEVSEVRALIRERRQALEDHDPENALIVVGMSTAPEAEALAQLRTHRDFQDIRILGISNVTNKAAGLGGSVPTTQEVLEAGPVGGKKLAGVLKALLPELT